ncbi:ArsA family ATPase [Methylonatrum kenyense]|uniref:ArsA family ATPase n=1 Tax=Methylonatrum kenyense TaxID=455253 RepID=UPI0031F522B4
MTGIGGWAWSAHRWITSAAAEVGPGTLQKLLERRIVFVGGKGGVGKTSVASALAVLAARRGLRVLVISTDPAHSLGDAVDRPIGNRITGITAGVWGLEIDPDEQARDHIRAVSEHMKQLAAPDMHAELDRQMALAAHSPGAAEAALLERVARLILEQRDNYDLLIFDTAPTGHTLRLLSLPEAMAAWTDGLISHNRRSEQLGKVLKHLTPEGMRAEVPTPFDEPDTDPFAGMETRTRRIAETLLERRRLFHRTRRLLTNPAETAFVFVLTPERLPIVETRRAVDALRQFDIPVLGAIVNRVLPEAADGDFLRRRKQQEAVYLQAIADDLRGLDAIHLPMLETDIGGLEQLDELADALASAGLT